MSNHPSGITRSNQLEYRRLVDRLIERIIQVILAYLSLDVDEQMQLSKEE